MALTARSVHAVTRATSLTAFRNASAPVEAGHAALSALDGFVPRLFAGTEPLHPYQPRPPSKPNGGSFEQVAECTPFQTFEWLAAWHRHIGARDGIVPVIVVGRFADGKTAFILPLAVEPQRSVRRLCWLGQELCDYNAPLLARDFSQRVTPDRFLAVWRELRRQMQADPQLRHDWIEFEKMPQTVGVQINPFTLSRRHAERQQRAYHAIGRRLGNVLPRQALFGDAPARPHQAQAHVRVRRDSLCHRHRPGRCAADARIR